MINPKIVCIFEDRLWSFKYKGERYDDWFRLFDLWTDVEYLENFFHNNKKDLDCSIEEAILDTIHNAEILKSEISNLAKLNSSQIDERFRSLHNLSIKEGKLLKQKSRDKCLRLYALKIDSGSYIITGGAIKLTKLMEDRGHTKNELIKLENCKNYLNSQGVFDIDSFEEFLIE